MPMRRWKKTRNRRYMSPWVFPSDKLQRMGKAAPMEGYLRKAWEKLLKDANLEVCSEGKKVTWHRLRHTFGTRIVRHGSVKSAQVMLGHGSLETTMRYVGAVAGDDQAAVDRLPMTTTPIKSNVVELQQRIVQECYQNTERRHGWLDTG